jgi:hypothetical protein
MSDGPLQVIADVEQDAPRPLYLQPGIFPQQMSSIGAVARSRHHPTPIGSTLAERGTHRHRPARRAGRSEI